MIEQGHTPGPWRVDGHPDSEMPCEVVKVFPNGDRGLVCELTHSLFRQNQKANARLIAAAPDLLEALRGLLTPCHCDPAPGTACAHVLAAEAAIARATGEE